MHVSPTSPVVYSYLEKALQQPAVAAGDETTLHYPKIQLIFSSTNNFVVKIIPRSLHLICFFIHDCSQQHSELFKQRLLPF